MDYSYYGIKVNHLSDVKSIKVDFQFWLQNEEGKVFGKSKSKL